MYAGDLIIISSQEGLQKSLNVLIDYCTKWKLNISNKKTKCMIFSKCSHTTKIINFTINSKNIEIVKEYKYLGIKIKSRNCTFIPNKVKKTKQFFLGYPDFQSKYLQPKLCSNFLTLVLYLFFYHTNREIRTISEKAIRGE